jgi:hypothetical protein
VTPRSQLWLGLGVLSAVASAYFGGRILRAPEQPVIAAPPALAAVQAPSPEVPLERAPEPEPERELLEARVSAVSGDAEVFLPVQGRWRRVEVDQTLGPDAVLRTKRGRVDLGIGSGIDVSVGPASQFRLRELSNRLSRVRLEGGRVTASVDGKGGPELLVQVSGAEAEARTNDGSFAMLRSENGQVTVASSRGSVRLSGAGQEVVVDKGQQSEVPPGGSPLPPGAIPGQLFIKLSQGQQRKLKQRSTLVEGETSRGAVVSVNGIETPTEGGRFSVRVPLREGKNDLEIVARDALGRESRKRVRDIDVDTKPPVLRGRVRW